MPKSRAMQWAVTGVVLAIVLSFAVVGFALRGRLAAAVGLDRPVIAPTVEPSVFEVPDEQSASSKDADLQPPALVPAPGKAPSKDELVRRISKLDTSKVLDANGKPATIAWEFLDATTGDVIASRNARQMLIPASNTKSLTVASVFNVFDSEDTFTTKVTQPKPGEIVLVGGGDPLLASEPAKPDSYPQPPSLRALARSTAKALRAEGTSSVELSYDASYFESSGWAATWPSKYRDQVTPIVALWADEGKVDGARQSDPAAAAAAIFARQLGEEGITVTGTPAVAKGSGKQLAAIHSLPVRVLAQQAMLRSNNSFTEALGLQLAKKTGHPTTFAGSAAAIQEQLTKLGIWEQGAHLDDASGLSRSNRVSASMLTQVNHHFITDARLTAALDGLPVAGVTGTLHQRFSDEISLPARGIARAKTGSLSFVSTFGGHTITADGSLVVFAVMLNGQVDSAAAKTLEDQTIGVLTGCGC